MRLLAAGLAIAICSPVSGAHAQTEGPGPTFIGPERVERWRAGDPVPGGYHVEDQPNATLVTVGYLVAGIPYGAGALAAVAAAAKNESGWLVVPLVGPWITLGQRAYGCNLDQTDRSQQLQCVADIFAIMGLISDGLLQATGVSLLAAGHLATRPGLVRDQAEGLRLAPLRVGTGAGAGVVGTF